MNKFILLVAAAFLINSNISIAQQFKASEYKTFSDDGAWCWFSDPRAVHLNGKVYSGWVSADGSIVVGSYNEATGAIKKVNISHKYNKDDHANPSFLILPDNRIMVFFAAHSRKSATDNVAAISYAISKNPEDISEWNPIQKITDNVKGASSFCYTNPVLLSEEKNRIYLFWRGGNFKPTFCYSDNLGKTWSKPENLIKSTLNPSKRPYMKISSNGKDEIHFAFTDGHPRNEAINSIYYLKYKGGKFYKADGTVVGSASKLPLEHESCDLVYNGEGQKKFGDWQYYNGVRGWIWDVAVDEQGNPTLVYTLLPEETKHYYYYSKWNGKEWNVQLISKGGSTFPRFYRDKGDRDREPHYSGGVYLDHENTNVVYYSKPVNDRFEIFKAETSDLGKTWKETAITTNSKKDNIRPYAVRGADKNAKVQVLWMYNDYYIHYTDYKSRIKLDIIK
ncbi:MAG: BNR-4 repeat-containing protein [Flavobacteriales bacterium]|nr:BNR-4 repeat-containing protein [Flavobacteriales bacterium]